MKTSSWNGDLEEEIYMEWFVGIMVKGQEKKVCMLVKCLYGLKQVPQLWYQKFAKANSDYGSLSNENDKFMYSRIIDGELYLYVIRSWYFDIWKNIWSWTLSFNEFVYKDLDEANVISKIKVSLWIF